jgi:hypothetical protein
MPYIMVGYKKQFVWGWIFMEIKRASEAGEGVRKKISDIFVDGFIQWLQYFSKDTEKLSRAFAHMFVLEDF